MGYEARCRVTVRDAAGVERAADATVLLETDELIVRGDARVKVPRALITGVRTQGGAVTIEHASGTVTLDLGSDGARKWAEKLAAPPKPLIDKLDVKPGAKVWVSGVGGEAFLASLRERSPNVTSGRAASACDVIFLAVERIQDLPKIARAAASLGPSGALWVVHPKGKDGVADTAIFEAARAIGLTYTKVARFSATHTAEKLVRPKAGRR